MPPLSKLGVLRRAVGRAKQKADAAATAAWRASRALGEALEAAQAYANEPGYSKTPHGEGMPSVRGFAEVETERLEKQARELHGKAMVASSQVGVLAEFMGANDR